MKSEPIAVLGPIGTYSAEAARQYGPMTKQALRIYQPDHGLTTCQDWAGEVIAEAKAREGLEPTTHKDL